MAASIIAGQLLVKPSQLSSRVSGGLPQRYAGNANPVATDQGTQAYSVATAPMTSTDPRVQNPKLNTKPWSVSYAQTRKPMSEKKARKMKKG